MTPLTLNPAVFKGHFLKTALLLCALAAFLGVRFGGETAQAQSTAPVVTLPDSLQTFPHDPGSFTQGLVYQNGVFWESTGLYGRSSLSKRSVHTGEVLSKIRLDSRFFGEGLALFEGQLIQLTWKNQTGFVYTPAPLRRVQALSYVGQGWGLAVYANQLIMSDGSSQLTYRDRNLQPTKRIEVRDGTKQVKSLNELETIQGLLWANVWPTDRIAILDPSSGRVQAWLDCSTLRERFPVLQEAGALNGIAFDPQNERVFVTGKLWPLVIVFSLQDLNLPYEAQPRG